MLKIISGGQTGVDRAALDLALKHGIECGGSCPAGRLDENGIIPAHYPLKELESGGFAERTLQNVKDSDATVIIYFGKLQGGSEHTLRCCLEQQRPYKLIEGEKISAPIAAEELADFVKGRKITTLNVAGPRQSEAPQGYNYAFEMLERFLSRIKGEQSLTPTDHRVNDNLPYYRDPDRIRQMFGSIARRYDLANHLLSCGIDFYWRRRAAEIVAGWQPEKVIDLAAGTGDLALAIAKRLPEAEITCADFSAEMLEIARRKGLRQTIVADALQLPFADAAFDCATVAFGLRNMKDWSAALREMSRVVKGNGHVLILDFSLPRPLLRGAYRFYLHHCLPRLGSIITGQEEAYAYLGASIEKFPSGDEMLRLIEANGFTRAQALTLTAGIATIYTADRL